MYNVTREGYSFKICRNEIWHTTEGIKVTWDGVEENIRNLDFGPFSLLSHYYATQSSLAILQSQMRDPR